MFWRVTDFEAALYRKQLRDIRVPKQWSGWPKPGLLYDEWTDTVRFSSCEIEQQVAEWRSEENAKRDRAHGWGPQ